MSENNGTSPDGEIIDGLTKLINDLVIEEQELRTRIESCVVRRKRYERARDAMAGKPPTKPGPKPKSKSGNRTRLSPERIAAVEADIRRFAKKQDEFRQVDIRTMAGASEKGSSQIATAFETLRQEPYNVIRLARREGNNKWFRLTPQAVKHG